MEPAVQPLEQASGRSASGGCFAMSSSHIRWLGKVLVACAPLSMFANPIKSPTSIFAPASTPAESIFGLSMFVLTTVAIVFVVVFGLLAYSVVKFRDKRDGD